MNEATNPQAGGDPNASSVVFDIGYQRYAGPREGRRRARLAVYKDGVRKALGLGRGAKTKLLPWAFISITIVIGIIMAVTAGVGQRTLGDVGGELAPGTSHRFFYELSITILFVFAALVAPRLLCPDRRNGTLHLYLVRPVTATDYVEARWAAFLTVMVLVAWLPQVVLFLGRVLGHPDPMAYLGRSWTDAPKFLLSGVAIAVMVTTVAMLASALTPRRGYASVLLIALYLIPGAVTSPLAVLPQFEWVAVFDLGEILGETNTMVFNGAAPATDGIAQPEPGAGSAASGIVQAEFGAESPFGSESARARFSATFLLAAYFGWLFAAGGILWTYYRKLTL